MIHPIEKFCGCLLPSTPRTDAARQRARSTSTLIDELQRCSEELERELNTLARHPSEEVNRRYLVPLQEAYSAKAAEVDRLREKLKAEVVGIPIDVNTVRWAKRCHELEAQNAELHAKLSRMCNDA